MFVLNTLFFTRKGPLLGKSISSPNCLVGSREKRDLIKSTILLETVGRLLTFQDTRSGTVGLVLGGVGVGKSVLCMQVAHEALAEGRPVLYQTTDFSPSQILDRMNRFGWDDSIYLRKTLKFVDMYSWQIDGDTKLSQTPYGIRVSPLNGTDLGLASRETMKSIEELRPVTILDSLTTLTKFTSEAEMCRRDQLFNARIRESGVGLKTMVPSAHSKDYVSSIAAYYDAVVELKMDLNGKGQRRLPEGEAIRHLRIRKWNGPHPDESIPFFITEKGVELKTEASSTVVIESLGKWPQ